MSKNVKITEVGPRDGLQNEKTIISTQDKVTLIQKLSQTGLKNIEVTSFVSKKIIPQLADAEEVINQINLAEPSINYSAIVANAIGASTAINSGISEISVLTAASQTFCQKNINCSIEESLERIQKIIELSSSDIKIRGYISCAVACPFEGYTPPDTVTKLTEQLLTLGCYEISLGDTIGVGTPKQILDILKNLKINNINFDQIALHLHNTYGQALASIYAALQMGINSFDSSIAGLGGCPYAPGASGNVATEDVVYMLDGLGLETGIDLQALLDVSEYVYSLTKRVPRSSVAQALLNYKN